MVLSAKAGRTDENQSEEELFKAVNSLHDEFKSKFGFTCCRALTKPVNWGEPEHHEYCIRFVEGAAKLTEEILNKLTDIH